MSIVRFDHIPEYAEIYKIEDFAGYVKNGLYNEYDGSGYISDGKVVWNIPINFEQLAKGIFPQNVSAFEALFTHVVWFAA
jgi:hypothetical protein